MMRILAVTILSMMWPLGLLAQEVAIRSGEHGDFTRLVFDLPVRAEWTLSDSSNSKVLAFDRPFQFQTEAVFDRIPRDRLTEVRQSEPGSLRLDLACDCDVDAFWHTATMLVVDIAENPGEQQVVKPRLRQVAAARTQEKDDKETGPITVWPRTKPSVSLAEQALTAPPLLNKAKPRVQANESLRTAQDLRQKRAQVLGQIARAASQGLLSPNVQWPSQDSASPQETKSANGVTSDAVQNPTPDEKRLNPLDNLRARSSIDRDLLAHAEQMNGPLSGRGDCLSDKLTRVANWGTDEPFGAQIGPLNRRLFGEFDKPDESVAVDLARLYVFFGFGAEAQRALGLVSTPSLESTILQTMAQILREGHASPQSVLSKQLDCTTSVAVWAALSYRDLPADMPIDTDAILRAFSGLPPHLRRYVGPMLSQKFLTADRTETANRILRILERGLENVSPQIGMAKAELKLAEGDAEGAGKTLDEVVEQNAEPSAQALVRRIETHWESGEDISFEVAQLAGAYASENRDATIHKDLIWAHVAALAASGAIHQAFDELRRIQSSENEALGNLENDVMSRLAQKADDLEFLQYALPRLPGAVPKLEPSVDNSIAARFLSLGFVDAARSYLHGPARGTAQRERQILRARVALHEGRPRQAEVELLGLAGADVNTLRAEARSRLGQHEAAAQLFASAGREDAARSQAWLAEDWEELAAEPDAPLSEVAEYMTAPPGSTEADVGQLRQSRDLLGESGEVREMLRDLLEARAFEADDG